MHSSGERYSRKGFALPWAAPTPSLVLSSDDVHIWLARLDASATRIKGMAQCLTEDECYRAGRFRFEPDRSRFIVGRAILRTILGRYLQIRPDRVRFSYDPRGKPFLAENLGDGTLRFNLAHSGEIALYAFTRGREIGVDIEYLRTMPDAGKIAERYFSPREKAGLKSIPESRRMAAFFHCWTRKEAYLKALGVGLSQPLDQFEVSFVPAEPTHLVDVEIVCKDASRWTLKALIPDPGYAAALAVEGHGWHPAFLQFPESTS